MHATNTGEGHPEAAAKAQEAIMGPHPNTINTFADLRCQDLLATVAWERQAATVVAPTLPWRMLSVRIVAFAAMFLGLRG